MKISKEEQAAIKKVLELGDQFGYGNLIMHLNTAWARENLRQYGMEPGKDIYPFAMQDDLVQRGEWDETGERYK